MRCAAELWRGLVVVGLALGACHEDSGSASALEAGTDAGTESGGAASGGVEPGTESTGSSGTALDDGSSSGDSTSGTGTPGPIESHDCPPDSFVNATNFGVPFLTTWCTGCHSSDLVGAAERQKAPDGLNFDDLEDVRAAVVLIHNSAGDDNDMMPPAGGPTAEDRAWFGEWLACGAP